MFENNRKIQSQKFNINSKANIIHIYILIYFNYIHLNSLKLTIRSYSSKKDNINYGGKNRRGCQKQFSRFQTVQQAHISHFFCMLK